jgi:hypothetical protein
VNHIFVSYRREDSADVTGRIADRLRSHFGDQAVFIDVDSIPYGVDFRAYLDEQVSKCQVLLAVIGRGWLTIKDETGRHRLQSASDFVRIEIEAALRRNIPVVPLLVQGAEMPAEKKLPDSLRLLRFRNGTRIRHDPDFHRDMDRLITNLEQHLRSGGDVTPNEHLVPQPYSADTAATDTSIMQPDAVPRAPAGEESPPPQLHISSGTSGWRKVVVVGYRLIGGLSLLYGILGFLTGDVPNVKVITSGVIVVSVGLLAAAAILVKQHAFGNAGALIAAMAWSLYFAFLIFWLG